MPGCDSIDSLNKGVEKAQNVSTDMKKEFGVEPYVGFNWQNGSLTNISIAFDRLPTTENLTSLESAAQKSVAKHFDETPSQITISFVIPGTPDKRSNKAKQEGTP
jgi:hypothetical protein